MKYKNKFKKIIILSTVILFFSVNISNAANSKQDLNLPWGYFDSGASVSNFNGLGVYYAGFEVDLPLIYEKIKINIEKKISFLRDNGNKVWGTNFNLDIGKKVTLTPENILGTYTWAGHTRNLGDYFTIRSNSESPSSHGAPYGYFTQRVTVPTDPDDLISITSKNPDIVSCAGKVCTALKKGTASLVVSFDKKTQEPYATSINFPVYSWNGTSIFQKESINIDSEGTPFYGTKDGYGRLKAVSAFSGIISGSWGNQKTLTYNLPDINYTVTVPEGAITNTDQTSSCSGITNITGEGATVNWSYSDTDNDPQSSYTVQISKDNSFVPTSIVKTKTAPSNTDVSSTRSVNFWDLDKNTNYYARVQTYNDENGWSDWSQNTSCDFTTNEIVNNNGVCSSEKYECESPEAAIDPGESQDGTKYTWTCPGTNGGQNEVCVLNKETQCGSNPNTCVYGTLDPTGQVDDSEKNEWYCLKPNGDRIPKCSLSKNTNNSGGPSCGIASGVSSQSAPTSNLCSSSAIASSVIEVRNLKIWEWKCSKTGYSDRTCKAPISGGGGGGGNIPEIDITMLPKLNPSCKINLEITSVGNFPDTSTCDISGPGGFYEIINNTTPRTGNKIEINSNKGLPLSSGVYTLECSDSTIPGIINRSPATCLPNPNIIPK